MIRRVIIALSLLAAPAAIPCPVALPAAQDASPARFDEARLAWDTGDFLKALDGFEAILKGPDAGQYFDRIALITGGLFWTTEITSDGRSARFSPDGRFFAYETGTWPGSVILVAAVTEPLKPVARVNGSNFAFSPSPNTAAYLRIKPTPEISALRKEIADLAAKGAPDRAALTVKQRRLSRFESKAAEIVVLDLATRKERVFKAEGVLKGALAWSADGKEVYFVGAKEADETSNEIYAVSDKGVVRPLTSGAGFKNAPLAVRGGKYLLYSTAPVHPFPKPPPPPAPAKPAAPGAPAAGQAAGQPQRGPGGAGGRGGFQGGGTRAFSVLNLADGTAKPFTGSSPAITTDGSTLIYVSQEGAESAINLVRLEGALAPTVVKKSAERISSAAPAPDGSAIVFDMPYTRNTEIFLIKADGKGETRLSREIQPDRAPRFLNAKLVLAVKGEPRHSRAYGYDLESGSSFRLFDNNSLRTIAPEYEWEAGPSGTKVLITADRDGDTVSEQRGIYLVDLDRKVAADDLLARFASQRAGEKGLRAKGERMFAPIRTAVQAAADTISITKLYDHEAALFDFDSKYIGTPGNTKAAEYIFNQLRSFGYEPERQPFETRGTKTANVLATLRGTENPEILYVLSGHFDSNQRSPGADDNTSVTAVNLETARVLAGKPLPCSIVFAFFTGEEAGLLGSREFVRVAREKKWLVAADLNNDMIGWMNDHVLDDTIRYTNAGIRDIQHAAAFLFSRLITHDSRYVRSTDAQSFYDVYGDIIGGLGSYPVLGNPYYHQPTDLLETVSHQLLYEAARYNTAAIMMLASSPMPVKDLKIEALKPASAGVSWTPSPEKGVVSYLVTYGPGSSPEAATVTVKEPRAALTGFQLKKGESLAVSVKAVTARGIEGWDAARASAPLK